MPMMRALRLATWTRELRKSANDVVRPMISYILLFVSSKKSDAPVNQGREFLMHLQ